MTPDFVIVGIVATYTAVAAVLQAIGPKPRPLAVLWHDVAVIIPIFAGLVILLVALDVLRSGKSFTSAAGWTELGRRCTRSSAILRWIVACIVFWPFMDVFGWYKSRIPITNPILKDPVIVRIDAALHFGHQPWELLQPVFGHPFATRLIDAFYHQIYPAVVIGVVVACSLIARGARRARFLVGFLMVWIIVGTVGGTLLASVGPCYYGRVFTDVPDPFAPLMRYLYSVNAVTALAAIPSQEFLWSGYTGQTVPLGISAMPSVHVAIAALLMCAAFDFRYPLVRLLGVLFWLATLVGSVATGWHYAVDGYVATVAVVVGWLVLKRVWHATESEPPIR